MIYKYDSEDKLIVAVDCIIFGFDNEGLKILLVKRAIKPEIGKWSLMGGFLKKDETLTASAKRVLKTLTGLENIYLEQLEAYSEVNRDPAERTISVAFSALLNMVEQKWELEKSFEAKWFPINAFPVLIFDHNMMVERALKRLRYKAQTQPQELKLLPKKFTMLQLRTLFEAILDTKLDKRNFTTKINTMNIVKRLDEKDMSSSKKGSYLYEFLEYD